MESGLYLMKKGDTLQSISEELGILNFEDLRLYHNMRAEIKDGVGPYAIEGKTLITPPKAKIEEFNSRREVIDKEDKAVKEEKKEKEDEQDNKKEEEQKAAAKSEHDDKYFVVHGATCSCDQSDPPNKTAKLVVTSNKKVVFNDSDGKFVATDSDTTFDPPAVTFGKCKLQPSSSGNLPCSLAPMPKWTKTYDKTKISEKTLLTEISILNCTIGGKIKIVKHGQTDSVMVEHAENTNPVELALLNPAVKMPVMPTAYPSVGSITLKSIANLPDFKPLSSAKTSKIEKVTIRQNQECTFEAKVAEGNVDLTSWVIFDGFTGDKNKKLLTVEQEGISFKNSFPTLGNYRVEGYGKPKKEEFEKGVYNKNDASCSIDVDVVLNTLEGLALETVEGENFARKKGNKMQLRQNFPATFAAKFLLPPTDQELENLEMQVTDASGSTIESTTVNGVLTFTPFNSKAQYTITATYTLDSGDIAKQSFTGETISNAVTGITHNALVIRPGTPMKFEIKTGVFSFFIPDEEAVSNEVRLVKWNLNGRFISSGKSITIPAHELMTKQKYVVEAYVNTANAYGTTAKDEEDDWHFEVKDNDVFSFKCLGVPKVGKTTQLQVSAFIMEPLLLTEQVVWTLPIKHKIIDKKTIAITPTVAGKQYVQCSINDRPGKKAPIDVKQAKIHGMLFTDSNGIEIQRASWGQTVNIWLKQDHLVGEEVNVEIWDKDYLSLNDRGGLINNKSYDGNLLSFSLNKAMESKTGSNGKLYIKVVAPQLTLANDDNEYEGTTYLEVQHVREIYGAHIGSQDGKDRHYHVDYDKVSYFYAKSRGIKPDEQLNLTIYEKGKGILQAKNVHADKSGMIKIQLEWNLLNPKTAMRIVYAVVKDKDQNILYNGAKVATGPLVITKKSAILKLAEYKSAVMVGKGSGGSGGATGVCVCKEYDLIWGNKVSCEFRKKVVEICKDLWKDNYLEMANNLMAVFQWETGGTFKSDVPNQAGSGATGLIQFMPARATEYFGTSTMQTVPNYFNSTNTKLHNLPRVKEFAEITALKQLDYVKKYFESQKNKKLDFIDFYLQVLFPVSSGKPEHVVFANTISKLDLINENDKLKELRVEKYSKNSGMDINNNGKILKSEIAKSVEKYKTEGLTHKSILKCENIKGIFSGVCIVGKVEDGFIINDRVIKNKVDSCNNNEMTDEVKIIVLHRTAGGRASGTLNWMSSQGYGAHFVNDYDGKIYQAIGLNKKGSHMGVNRLANTQAKGWGNSNSIGIETCGLSLDEDGNNTILSHKPHHHWEAVTDAQAQSIACLLKFLLNHFNLSQDSIKVHEELCSKTALEGKIVYDAMLPYLK